MYIHEQISALSAGVSTQISQQFVFHNIAFQPASTQLKLITNPLQQTTHQNSNYLEILNRRRGVAAEPSNRHEEKKSSFRPGFTLVDS